jgi:hypothetical protein
MSCMVLVGCAQAEEKGKTGDETKSLCTHRYKSSEKIVVVNRQSVSCETVEPSNSWTALFFYTTLKYSVVTANQVPLK